MTVSEVRGFGRPEGTGCKRYRDRFTGISAETQTCVVVDDDRVKRVGPTPIQEAARHR